MVKRSLVALAAAFSMAPAAGLAQEGKTAEEKIDEVKGRVDSAEEQVAEMKVDLSGLKKIKLSGYVQGRWQESRAAKTDTGTTSPATANDGFSVRRGRLKATYDGSISEYVLQIDAVPSGVTLKDAEATLKLPWLQGRVTIGQTKWPFGYEVLQSSGDRQMPERTRVVGAFAPGERDRGIKLSAKYQFVDLKIGVFTGNGTGYRGYNLTSNVAVTPTGLDNDTAKDVLGRLGVDFGFVVAGVSYWTGDTFRPAYTPTGQPTVPGAYYTRDRLGVDAQVYLDLLPIGGTALKGEFITGETPYVSGYELLGKKARGWYLFLSQWLGTNFEVVARYDTLDLDTGAGDTANAQGVPGSLNRVDTFGFGALWHPDGNFKVAAIYEIPTTGVPAGGKDPADNLFTLQVQAKF